MIVLVEIQDSAISQALAKFLEQLENRITPMRSEPQPEPEVAAPSEPGSEGVKEGWSTENWWC